MQQESQIQDSIIRMINACFPQAYHYKAHDETTFGIPDIIGCLRGRFFAIEVKREDGKLTRLQQVNLILIKEAEGYSTVARSSEDAKKFLIEMEKDILNHG